MIYDVGDLSRSPHFQGHHPIKIVKSALSELSSEPVGFSPPNLILYQFMSFALSLILHRYIAWRQKRVNYILVTLTLYSR